MFFLSQTRPVRPRTYAGVGPESYGIRLDPNQSLWFGSGPVGRRSRSVWVLDNSSKRCSGLLEEDGPGRGRSAPVGMAFQDKTEKPNPGKKIGPEFGSGVEVIPK